MLLQKVLYLLASSMLVRISSRHAADRVQEELKQRGDKAAQDFQQLVGKDLAAFNTMLREHNIQQHSSQGALTQVLDEPVRPNRPAAQHLIAQLSAP